MESKDVLLKIQDVFREILDNDDLVIDNTTTAADIEEWDSLTHIQLVVAIEKRFRIKFSSKEILSWKNIGEMIDSVQIKL